MGRQQVTLTVTASVSRHNSDQDKKDDADWEELCHRVWMIIKEHKYENISPNFF